MSTEVRQVWTRSGKRAYAFTVGTTYYQRVKWNDVIDILNERREDLPKVDAGYGQGRYMGD